MGMYVNSLIPYEAYSAMVSDTYFVDKSRLIEELIPALRKRNNYFCITRPRRFGKSVMASMVGAFFEKNVDSRELFDRLAIADNKDYLTHLNKHNVIFIDFSRTPEMCDDYRSYIVRISDGIREDLASIYKDIEIRMEDAVWDVLQKIFIKTGDKFIFVMDEWDAVFHMSFISEDERKEYLLYIKNLLKDQVYVELAYMTGVLPITRNHAPHGTQESVDSFVGVSGESLQAVFPADTPYSSGSELNMFVEYNMVRKRKFSEYFGFSEKEVDKLYEIYKNESEEPRITREDLQIWYDGYYTITGKRLYNPRSIVCALTDNELASYWTSSGPYDEIFYYIRDNIEAVRDNLVLMLSGEGVEAKIYDYAAVSMKLETKDEIYSVMVVYGLLTYEDGKVFVPNREIMEQFGKMLMTKDSLGYVHRLAKESEKMLKATLAGNTEAM